MPKYLADRILTSKSAIEGERKQVTVLFADMKGSMELLADRDPEQARTILDPVVQKMIDAVHRYEGTVNQGRCAGALDDRGGDVPRHGHGLLARSCRTVASYDVVSPLPTGDPECPYAT